jgi:hypothetical protein
MDVSSEAAALVRLYRTDPATFRAETVTLTLWQHGGGPGPGLSNEALELELRPDRVVNATYNRTTFDLGYAPPFFHERFTGRVPADQAEKLLAEVLGGPLLLRDHPSERDPGIGGVMKEEWEVKRGAARAHKLFYDEPFPADYAGPRALGRALMDELVQHGARELRSRKVGAP